MSEKITVGCNVVVKVGCREIAATVLEINDGTFTVRSNASGKVFKTGKVTTAEPEEAQTAEPEVPAEAETPNPAPECQPVAKPEKKLSLMDAAVKVLKMTGEPMNTREMVQVAILKGLWIPTSCKTPEQTLYGSIFREMSTKENPRIIKSEQKGKFKFTE